MEKHTIKLQNKVHAMHKTKASIFNSILGHIGIKKGDRVDSAVKSTSGMVIDGNFKIPCSDIKKKEIWWWVHQREMATIMEKQFIIHHFPNKGHPRGIGARTQNPNNTSVIYGWLLPLC